MSLVSDGYNMCRECGHEFINGISCPKCGTKFSAEGTSCLKFSSAMRKLSSAMRRGDAEAGAFAVVAQRLRRAMKANTSTVATDIFRALGPRLRPRFLTRFFRAVRGFG